jgi:WD40 repeat protein
MRKLFPVVVWAVCLALGGAALADDAKPDEKKKEEPKNPPAVTSPDGRTVATASDNAVVMTDAASQKTLWKAKGHTGMVTAIAFSPDGKTVITGGADKAIRIWDVSTGKNLRMFKGHTRAVTSITVSADGKTLTSAGGKETREWDLATGKLIKKSEK